MTAVVGKTKKPSHYLFAPGTKAHGLAISKNPVKSDQINKAKARSGANKLIRGTCQKVKSALTFYFHGESNPPELKKKALEETIFELTNKRVTCAVAKSEQPYDEGAIFEDEIEGDDEGVNYQTDLQDTEAPLSQETQEELLDEKPGKFQTLMDRINPRYKMALERNKELKELSEVKGLLSKGGWNPTTEQPETMDDVLTTLMISGQGCVITR